jgi:hypothetical protein
MTTDWAGQAFRVEIETSTPDTYLDVTDDYVSAKWSTARRQKWGQGFSPGSATVTLNNDSGDYWADAATAVAAGRKLRISSLYSGPSSPFVMFAGYVDGVRTPKKPGGPVLTTIRCKTALSIVAGTRRVAVSAVGASDTETERIDRILDSVGWSSSLRTITIGSTERTAVPATTLDGSAVTELNVAAASWLSSVLEDVRTGKIQYVNAFAQAAINALTATLYIREYGAAHPTITTVWPTIQAWEMTTGNVINYASSAEVGGTPTVEQSAASQAKYGFRDYIRADLICTSGVAPLIAYYQVARFAEPLEYPTRILLTEGSDAAVAAILNLGLLYKVEVAAFHTGQMSLQVVGMEHTITPARSGDHPDGRTDTWRCTLLTDRHEYVTGTTPD